MCDLVFATFLSNLSTTKAADGEEWQCRFEWKILNECNALIFGRFRVCQAEAWLSVRVSVWGMNWKKGLSEPRHVCGIVWHLWTTDSDRNPSQTSHCLGPCVTYSCAQMEFLSSVLFTDFLKVPLNIWLVITVQNMMIVLTLFSPCSTYLLIHILSCCCFAPICMFTLYTFSLSRCLLHLARLYRCTLDEIWQFFG